MKKNKIILTLYKNKGKYKKKEINLCLNYYENWLYYMFYFSKTHLNLLLNQKIYKIEIQFLINLDKIF